MPGLLGMVLRNIIVAGTLFKWAKKFNEPDCFKKQPPIEAYLHKSHFLISRLFPNFTPIINHHHEPLARKIGTRKIQLGKI